MSFFEDVGKAVTQMGNDTVKMTREFSEVAKLNSQISNAENNLKGLYQQLGMQLYEDNKNNTTESPYSAIYQAIAEQRVQVEQCKEQIRIIKGITRCSNCGNEMTVPAAFCANCGISLAIKNNSSENVPPVNNVCSKCGTPYVGDNKFCMKCGTPRNN